MINGLNNMYTDITNLYDINADDITSTNLVTESINGQDSALFDGISSNIQDQLDSLSSGITSSGGGFFVIDGSMSNGFTASRFFQFGGSVQQLAVNIPLKFDFDFKVTAISINLAASMGSNTAVVKLYKNNVAITTHTIDSVDNLFNNLNITFLSGDTLNLYCSSVANINFNGNFVRATISCAVNGVTGPQGVAGTNGTSFNWKSAWSNSITYVAKDVVRYNGSSYIALLTNTNSTPPSVNWSLMAQKGNDGTNGINGIDGIDGKDGKDGSDANTTALGITVAANTTAIAALGVTVTALGVTVSGIQTSITGINTNLANVNESITELDGKTQYMTANLTTTTTSFGSKLSSTGDITTNQDVFSRNLQSTGTTTTLGQSINTQTNILGNNIYLGELGSIVYIGGLAYTPFSSASSFFSQW